MVHGEAKYPLVGPCELDTRADSITDRTSCQLNHQYHAREMIPANFNAEILLISQFQLINSR